MAKRDKRFEDWDTVECNDCERWWLNQCDGVPKDAHKPCNSFLATRGIVIPEKIKALEKRVECLRICCIINTGLILGLMGVVLTHG